MPASGCLVGRQTELSQLILGLTEDTARAVVVCGDPGVGKTSLINAILFGAAMHYKRPEHKNKVVLVLVPSRELRYDLCQDVLNTGVFDDTEVLWLGRPPLGRTDGLWEDRLADSMRELNKYVAEVGQLEGATEVGA